MDESFWSRFSADPRVHGMIRASDADRAVVTEMLAEAFALGQLDPDEFDERSDSASRVKTLGEIPGLVADLIVVGRDPDPAELDAEGRARALARLTEDRIPITPEQIDAAARDYYRRRIRQAVIGMVAGPVGITLAIWAVSSIASGGAVFFWPMFIIVPMLFGLVSEVTGKDRIIDRRTRELTQRARAHLGDAEARRRSERGTTDEGPSGEADGTTEGSP